MTGRSLDAERRAAPATTGAASSGTAQSPVCRFDIRVALAIAAAVLVFAVAFGVDWPLPGLYMDAVNPEYLIPGILDPSAPGYRPWILPGNMVADRYPIFTGSIYHGSAQLYFALPWMMLFDIGVGSLRMVQAVVGVGILALLALFAARSRVGYTRWLAASVALLLALDASFVMSLRTQAYSCLFPLLLLLGSLLLADSRESRPSTLRLLAGGALYGLSVFSYFIYAFFAPVVLWRIFRGESRGRSWLRNAALWLIGAAIGYAPFLVGLLLLRDSLGSWDALVGWLLNHGERMKVMGESSGAIDHVRAVLTDFGSVIIGDWPHRMILQSHEGHAIGVIKAVVLIGMPVLTFALALRRNAEARRFLAAPLLLTLVFLAIASVFGERLDGHHYTILQPLLYAAFGIAVATLIGDAPGVPVSTPKTGRRSLRAAIAFVSVSIVACANAFDLARFHVDLRASGGAQLYSDAIDRFAADVQRNDPNATVYLPDWGFVMPIMFITRAQLAQFEWVDPVRMHRELCEGKPQVVVFLGTGNGEKFRFVAGLASQEPGPITTWSQRDGKPVFESMRLSPRECPAAHEDAQSAAVAKAEAGTASIEVSPSSVYTCSFLSPSIATVHWDAGNETGENFDVWIAAENRPLQPWTHGAAQDERATGQWAQAGMRFTLIDPRTNREIVGTRIESLGCPFPESNTPS